MYKEILFHGSKRSRGEKFIQNKEMEPSKGKKHWLGDGSYFFVEDFYSYKWIVEMFKARHHESCTYDNLNKHYLILTGEVCIEKNRVFDLTRAEHKILFDRVYKKLDEKNEIKHYDIAEGVVLNYMFNKLNYHKLFDVVKAVFSLNKYKYEDIKTRVGYMPQEQVCIKNNEVVNDIKEYNFKERIDTFNILINDMYFDNVKPETTTYKRRKSYYPYSKRKISE
ncbi:hypothetical protein ACQCU1_18905 [Sutcliffiella horikoshii]|uniref:hypothetical protein n=1 Tax=Sutcliffiella horikoshii TaxID=79883 RepID=UPI003CEB8051